MGSYCGKYAKIGECEHGHRYLKIITCNRDWCRACRKFAHDRRIGRLLPKVVQMQAFGFFTFTVPQEQRQVFTDKKKLSQLRKFIKRKLKRFYGDELRGVTRWHWFGDRDLTRYNPHFNAMVDGLKHISKSDLEKIKQDYKKATERISGIEVRKTKSNPEAKVDVHYYYFSPESIKQEFLKKRGRNYKILNKKTRKEIKVKVEAGYSLDEVIDELYRKICFHRLRYLTRPTFLVYQEGLAQKLKGYRNSLTWGKFPDLSYEQIEKMAKQKEAFTTKHRDLIALTGNICPKCGSPLNWFKGLFPGSMCSYGEEIDGGYFSLSVRVRGSPKKINWERIKQEIEWRKSFYSDQFRFSSESMDQWEKQEKERVDIYG